MSKFKCLCGETISDTHYPRPTAGVIVKQMDEEKFYDRVSASIAEFMSAVADGRRDQWITSRFGDQYPKDLDDASVVSDLLAAGGLDIRVLIDECPSCGRLHVQKQPESPRNVSYVPDAKGYQGVLRGSPGRAEEGSKPP